MNTVNDKRASRGLRMMKVVVNSKEKKLADRELRRRLKELDRERLILVSMEQIAVGNGYLLPGVMGQKQGRNKRRRLSGN